MPSTSTDVTQQRIYRATTAGGPYTLVTTIPNNTTAAYADAGLANFTTYFYVIRAFDATQESPNSVEASATPIDNQAASAPTALTVVDHPADQGFALDLTWTPSTSTDVTQQRIYRGTSAGGPYTLVTTVPNNTTGTFTDTGLANFTAYYYIVRAFDGTQESPNSNEANATPVDNLAPAAPTTLSAVDHPADQGFAIDLAWVVSTSSDVTEQRLYRSTTAGGPYTLVTTFTDNTTAAFTDTGLTNDTSYYYVVRSYDATQESANSNEANAAPLDNIASPAPTALAAVDHPADQGFALDLSWTPSVSIDVTEHDRDVHRHRAREFHRVLLRRPGV
jgi:cellulose 1,4-beta-cellobiosidase